MTASKIFRVALVAAALPLTAGTAGADPTIIVFDPPDSTGSATSPNSLSKKGEVVGTYSDNQFNLFGYLRKKNGSFVTVGEQGDQPMASNGKREIVGQYLDGSGRHGFIIPKRGSIARFDAPGADGSGIGTQPLAVNDKGEVAGIWGTSAQVWHGFLRDPGGGIIVFDEPNAGTQLDQGTFVQAMNAKGTVAGYYVDSAGAYHGFLRSPKGKYTKIDATGAGTGRSTGTQIFAIDEKAVMSGVLTDSSGASHGLLIEANGKQTTFDIPNRSTMAVTGMNDADEIVGHYQDSSMGKERSFLRDAAGNLTIFDASDGTTFACDINDKGVISGFTSDSFGDGHSFLRTP